MQQGEFDKKEQLELHTDEYIANFDFFVNCSEQPKEWLDWLKLLGLSVIDAKRIDEELALLPDRELANAELTALSLTSSKYFISTQDILLEKILPPSCYADKIRLAVLKRVLMANKFSNPQDEWQASQDNKIRDKLTEINLLLGYQPYDEQQADTVEDIGTRNHTGIEPKEREVTAWLRETWIKEDKMGGTAFFNKLKKYTNIKGSPIVEHYSAGKVAGIRWKTSAGSTGEMKKKTILTKVSLFKNTP